MQPHIDQGIDLKGSLREDGNLGPQKGAVGLVAHPHSTLGKNVGGAVAGIRMDSVKGNGTNFVEDDLAGKKKAVFGSGHQILGRNSLD
ncbi:hypothetical protein XANCAGTX0491_002140 [Xanthoria calcicola]